LPDLGANNTPATAPIAVPTINPPKNLPAPFDILLAP